MKDRAAGDSPEKALKLYGIDFYTRVCFREYQFTHMIKLLEDGLITKTADLKTIKALLEKERLNSDKDLRINEFASEINLLMKSLNARLKKP